MLIHIYIMYSMDVKKIKKYKVGIDSETEAISMVTEPAIESDFVFLSKDKAIVKEAFSNDEKHMVYGAVLRPDFPIYRNDGENEYYLEFTSESIERMARDYMMNYRQGNVTIQHEEYANEVFMVESWIKQDMDKDKSVSVGLDKSLPIGTWFCGFYVNNNDVWERIKSGELKGFSVEAMIDLEDFAKVKKEDAFEMNESFWSKLKSIVNEALGKKEEKMEVNEPQPTEPQPTVQEPKVDEPIVTEPQQTVVEEPKPTEPQPTVQEPKVDEPQTTEPQPTVVEEPKPTEPQQTVQEPKVDDPKTNEPKVDEPKPNEPNVDDGKHLNDLIASLREEISALKEANTVLVEKVNDLGKMPSANPINVNGQNGTPSTYSSWRDMMAKMI